MTALLLVLIACSPARMAKAREDVDRAALGEAVAAYWKAAQWNDVAGMSGFLARPEDQLLVAKVAASPVLRVTEGKVLQVVVGPELVVRKDRDRADLDAQWRVGTALVRVEAWGLADQRVTAETIEQAWTMGPRGWTVDTSRSPLDADRPW